MNDTVKKATRESYGEALASLGEKYDFLVLDADCGIAESNMTGIAAGIATTGKTVFISSFAMFAAGRNFEQVRNSIGYPHLNVKIGATHAGITVGEDGATHQCLEDIALMRTIPGMTVIVPADDIEAKACCRIERRQGHHDRSMRRLCCIRSGSSRDAGSRRHRCRGHQLPHHQAS